ncbi:TPA: hypothetical protein ACGMCE_002041 [Streptococcus agalactiae]
MDNTTLYRVTILSSGIDTTKIKNVKQLTYWTEDKALVKENYERLNQAIIASVYKERGISIDIQQLGFSKLQTKPFSMADELAETLESKIVSEEFQVTNHLKRAL